MLTTMFLLFNKIADAKPEQVLMEECTELRTEINKKDVAIAKHHEKYVISIEWWLSCWVRIWEFKKILKGSVDPDWTNWFTRLRPDYVLT